MKKNILIALCLVASTSMAQTPKWASKMKKAVFSVVTYDAYGKIINNTNGFFINDKGVALSDYRSFEGASKAEIIDADGNKYQVKNIIGANNIYDIVKFTVDLPAKSKITFLNLASAKAEKSQTVYLLPYSTQKNVTCQQGIVEEASLAAQKYSYYTFSFKGNEKYTSTPVLNTNGECIALVQKCSGSDAKVYGMDVLFGSDMQITAMSGNDPNLKRINIKSDIPDEVNDALVYMMMNAGNMTDEQYISMVDDFVKKFPNSPDGYLRRCNFYVDTQKFEQAEENLKLFIEKTEKKDDACYNVANVIYRKCLSFPEPVYKDWTLDRALREIQTAIALNKMPFYTQLMGDILFAQKKYDGAFDAYLDVCHQPKATAENWFAASRAKEMMGGDKKECIALMDSALNTFIKPYTSQAAPFLYERAQLKAELDMNKEAWEDYNECQKAQGIHIGAEFFYLREQTELKLKMWQQAYLDINKAAEIAPEEITFQLELASVCLRVNKIDEAIAAAQRAANIDGNSADAFRILGFSQAQKGDKVNAKKNLEKAKSLGDDKADGLIKKFCK